MLFMLRSSGMSTVTTSFTSAGLALKTAMRSQKHYRFFDIMGNENHGFLVPLPDAQAPRA